MLALNANFLRWGVFKTVALVDRGGLEPTCESVLFVFPLACVNISENDYGGEENG